MDTESPTIPEPIPFNPEDYSLKEILNPKHSALVVIDMQNDFLHPDGFFAKHEKQPIEQMQSTVPHIQRLIEAARKANIPIIFTKGYEDVAFRKGPDLRRSIEWKEVDGDGSVNSQSGTWGAEFYEGLEPQEGDIVVEKHKWSAFNGKNKEGKTLKEILDMHGIKTLVMAGVVAETCIETSVRDAYDQDYFVVVPQNSVGSNDPEQLQIRMKYWGKGFVGDAKSEDEIIQYWPPAEGTT